MDDVNVRKCFQNNSQQLQKEDVRTDDLAAVAMPPGMHTSKFGVFVVPTHKTRPTPKTVR